MEFILLIICSVIIARYFEKKSKIAATAHAILFIVLSFYYLVICDVAIISKAMTNIIGEFNYNELKDSFIHGSEAIGLAISSFFLFEVVVFVSISAVALVAFIKAAKKISKKIKNNNNFVSLIKTNITKLFSRKENSELTYKNNYLIFSRLLN